MFEKNIELIDNISLKRRLQKISTIESKLGISYCVTQSGDYILLKNDVPIDDINNPREAIRKSLKSTIKNEMKKNDFIITFGIGLGYLLDEVFNTYPSKIYIYEPDINLLHFVLNNVDISEHLSSGRIYISSDLDELITRLSQTYITGDKIEIAYLQNYAVIKNKELLLLTQKVFDSCKSKMVDINTITKFSKVWLSNSIYNISKVNDQKIYLLSDLYNKFTNQTAILVGAGPSLNENIDKIIENRKNLVIFAVNKVVRDLIQKGIIPDFVVCLDACNMNKTLGGLETYLSKVNCIMDSRVDSNIHAHGFNKIFYTFSDTDFLVSKLAKYNNQITFIESGGTAMSLALVSAAKMGFSKIVAVGLDLAFKDNEIYSSGEKMTRISQEEILVDSVKKNLVQVKSVTGGTVYTRDDYATFIHHFETLIKGINTCELYNLSSFGAQINGMKNITFDDLNLNAPANMVQLAFVEPCSFNIKEFIQEEFKEINNIISLLSKGSFSSALVSAMVKSVFVYQYMQADILKVLQRNFAPDLAEDFINETKKSIKAIVDILQKNKMI